MKIDVVTNRNVWHITTPLRYVRLPRRVFYMSLLYHIPSLLRSSFHSNPLTGTLYIKQIDVVHSEVESCIEQTSRFEVKKGAGGEDAKGRCMKKHDDGYDEIAMMLRRGGFNAPQLTRALMLRGTVMTPSEARVFLQQNDKDPRNGRLSKSEIIKGLDSLTAMVHIGDALVVPKDMYELLESLKPDDFSNLRTLNTFTPSMFASLLRKKGATHFSDEDARVLLDSLVSSEDLMLNYEKLQKGLVKIKNLESYNNGDDSSSSNRFKKSETRIKEDGSEEVHVEQSSVEGGGSIFVISASYGLNCDLENIDNILEQFREHCHGMMSCSFEPDWTPFPSESSCHREIDVSFMCPDASTRHVLIGSGCSDTNGGSGNTCSDARGSVAELSCEQEENEEEETNEHVIPEEDDVDILGGGWRLVRRVRQGNQWHPSTDSLDGTEQYGPEDTILTGWRNKTDVTWTTPFHDANYDQVLVSLCDMSRWAVISKAQLEEKGQSTVTLVASSRNALTHNVRWYNRHGDLGIGDPLITLTRTSSAVNTLYREASKSSSSSDVPTHGGACVFIRLKEPDRGQVCPVGEYDVSGVCSQCRDECPIGSFKDGGCIGHFDTLCSTCDEMCSETEGCLKRGTLKGTSCSCFFFFLLLSPSLSLSPSFSLFCHLSLHIFIRYRV